MFNIPAPENHNEAARRGLEVGSSYLARLLQQKFQQNQLAQQQEHFLQNFGINQSRENRLSEMHPYQIAAAQQEQEMGPEKFNLLQARIEAEKAKANKAQDPYKQMRLQQLVQSHRWNSTPSSVKDNIIALGNGLGIPADKVVEGMTNGRTLEEIGSDYGYKPEDIQKVTAKYLPTAGNVKLENERQKNVAELNAIEHHVSEGLAPYIGTFGGYSQKQVIDAIKGQNADKQAKYLAARSLQPELAAIRIKVMGGNVGQGAIEELVHSALGSSKVLQGMVTPEVYKKMNHYISEWLREGSKAATSSIYGRGGKSGKSSESIEDLTDEQLEAMRNG